MAQRDEIVRPPLFPPGSGATRISFQVVAPGPYLGQLSNECDYVTVEIIGISCNSSGYVVGQEVKVWDRFRCKFNLPIEVLSGAYGGATLMVNDGASDDCADAIAEEGACRFEVDWLCCTEEIYGD